ncbi:MAG: xanthine dehydrogenase family protein molybdopterin-binding subunit [Rhizobiaceae bacterium]|nr:xanthine dehydrogenase family protein molybdopterin-binding subunit [Rhizobiaceae bacterium]
MTTKMMPNRQVGRSVKRLESHSKVTGRAEYTHNLRLPGMLHTKIVRSTVAHGLIRAIDVEAAKQVPGVHAVITGEDVRKFIPQPYFGPAFHDQPILALDKVRYVGEAVVVVVASDPHIADQAAQLVVVDYEELPAVFDEIEAAKSDVYVHEELRPAGTFPDLKHLVGIRNTNIALDFSLTHGEPEKAFAEADHVFEHTFTTQQVMHTPFEPMISIGEPTHSGLTLHTASQSPSFVRIEIARLLGWPENKVRVKTGQLGGGFGAKLYIKLEALAAALALMLNAPVRVALTMEEQFYTITKHATTFHIRSGVTKDGRIVARDCDVWWNGGAYADIGPRVTQKSGFTAAGPYDIENVKIKSAAVYTNRPPAGALRGFGIPQLVWAYESHIDLIARELGIDPLEMRRKNILRNGRPQATGTIMKDAAIEQVLERTAERMNWSAPFDKGSGTRRRGRGIAIGFKASVAPTTSVAMVNIAADGSCSLYSSTVDMGQASETAMAQIVAEVLALETENIRVVRPDTDITPYDMATLGSRSTFHMGNAVRLAAEDAKQKLDELAREVGLTNASDVPLSQLFIKKYGMQAGNVIGVGTYIPPYKSPDKKTGQSDNATPFWMIGATGVELEVDTETGHVKLLRMVNVCDLGTPLNPKVVETQISGAAVMQIGFTMSEIMNFDAGQVTNASLADYKIPSFHDLPDLMENEAVDAEQTTGPFGAKGVGESSTFGVSPAIANAIQDAVGVRISSLPITPEAVYRAIAAADNRALEEE